MIPLFRDARPRSALRRNLP